MSQVLFGSCHCSRTPLSALYKCFPPFRFVSILLHQVFLHPRKSGSKLYPGCDPEVTFVEKQLQESYHRWLSLYRVRFKIDCCSYVFSWRSIQRKQLYRASSIRLHPFTKTDILRAQILRSTVHIPWRGYVSLSTYIRMITLKMRIIVVVPISIALVTFEWSILQEIR